MQSIVLASAFLCLGGFSPRLCRISGKPCHKSGSARHKSGTACHFFKKGIGKIKMSSGRNKNREPICTNAAWALGKSALAYLKTLKISELYSGLLPITQR